MNRYVNEEEAAHILRDRFIEVANRHTGYTCDAGITFQDAAEMVFDWMDKIPPADAAPIRRGKWIKDEFWETRCSECDGLVENSQVTIFGWCPYCGAKMER